MNITTCTSCGKLYEEASEEEANNPNRTCNYCFDKQVRLSNEIVDEILAEEKNEQKQ